MHPKASFFFVPLIACYSSVERVVEYLELPQEPPAIIEDNRPPAYWPSSTTTDALIKTEDLVVKYAPDLPAVLHGISFSLKARERVGLLGRTGKRRIDTPFHLNVDLFIQVAESPLWP